MMTAGGETVSASTNSKDGQSLNLGPKAGYWRALGPFVVTGPFALVAAGIAAYDYLSTDFRPGEGVLGAWIVFGVFGVAALLFLPGVLASRKGATLAIDTEGIHFARGSKMQHIPWAEVTEVTYGPRRIRLGKTSSVAEAIRVRGAHELLPIEVDEVNYRVDHAAWMDMVPQIVQRARAHDATVGTPTSTDW